MNPTDDEASLRKKADEVRARLLEVVDELDRRRHSFAHPMKTVRAMPIEPVWYAMGAAAALLGFSLVGVLTAKSRRRNRRMRKLVRIETQPPTFSEDVASRAGRALAAFALVQLGKRAMTRFGAARPA